MLTTERPTRSRWFDSLSANITDPFLALYCNKQGGASVSVMLAQRADPLHTSGKREQA